MRFLWIGPALLLVIGIAISAPLAQTGTRLEGVVIHAQTGEPLPRVQVLLARPGSGEATARFTTGPDGRFQFLGVPAADYEIEAARNGFILQSSRLALTAAKPVTDMVFRLVATGVVTGRVRDPRGEPALKVTVSLLSLQFDGMFGRHMAEVAQDLTDDRGEYRIYGVPPGNYFLRVDAKAEAKRLSLAVPKDDQVAPTYYPGTTDPFSASLIAVRGGAELAGLDVPLLDVPLLNIRGTIVDEATGRPPAAYAGVLLIPRSPPTVLPYGMLMNSNNDYAYSERTGIFEVSRVPPGTYWIRVSSYLSGPAGRVNLTALQPIEVRATDVSGVNIILKPNASIKTLISSDGAETPSSRQSLMQAVRLSFYPNYGGEAPYTPPVVTNGDASFGLDNIAAGEYRVTTTGMLQQIYFKDVKLGGVDVLSAPLTISGTPPDLLNIVVGTKPGQIAGIVLDAVRRPLAGTRITLVPDRSRTRIDLYRSSITNAEGRFRFFSVAPGDYKIFREDALSSGGFFERDNNPQFELQGFPVHVDESSNLNLEIKL